MTKKFKIGDRVRVVDPENKLLKYEGFLEGANGTVLRLNIDGKIRVQIDGTAEMGTEGDVWSDFEPECCTLLDTSKPKKNFFDKAIVCSEDPYIDLTPVQTNEEIIERIERATKNKDKLQKVGENNDLVYRLRKRAEIRRNIPHRKSVQNNEPDRIANILEEAASEIERLRKDLHAQREYSHHNTDSLLTAVQENGIFRQQIKNLEENISKNHHEYQKTRNRLRAEIDNVEGEKAAALSKLADAEEALNRFVNNLEPKGEYETSVWNNGLAVLARIREGKKP